MPFKMTHLIGVFLFLLSYYSLNAQIGSLGGFNNIGLSNKNDLVLNAGLNFSQSLNYEDNRIYDNFKTYDAQIAYAFYKHLGVQAGYQNFILFNDDNLNLCESQNCKQSSRDHYFNVALGAFYKFNLNKTTSIKKDHQLLDKAHILLDIYVGYGKGMNTSNILNFNGSTWNSGYILHFENYYLQPDFMLNGRFTGGGFSTFYSLVKFDKIILLRSPLDSTTELINSVEEFPTARIYGLNFKLWLGLKQVKLVYNLNRKYILNSNKINNEYGKIFNNYSNLISLQLNLIDLFK